MSAGSSCPELMRDEIAALRADLAAFMKTHAAVIAPTKRIELSAVYSVNEAAELVPVSASGLRKMARLRTLKAKGGGKGRPWRVLGSELVKIGGAS